MHPLVGLRLRGAHLTPRDRTPHALGQPVWGPRALAADLGLRLGLAATREDPMTRLAAWYERLRDERDAFFAPSLEHDPWGTTRTVMTLHDALVDGGWDGAPIDDAGPRVATLTRLVGLPGGDADALHAIEARLASARHAPYHALTLAEPITRWPMRWRRIVKRLDDLGAVVDVLARATPIAAADTDLGRVQRCLADGVRAPLTGDGTLVLLQAETCEPLADTVAAWLAAQSSSVAILRTAATGPLEAAMAAHGLPRLGGLRASGPAAASAWLPLVLQLAREPFDPEAAVDLLLLPHHELPGRHRHAIARALSDNPGLVSPDLIAALEASRHGAPDATRQIERWLTPTPSHSLGERLEALAAALARRVGVTHQAGADRVEHVIASDALALARAELDAVLRLLPREGASVARALDDLLRGLSQRATPRLTRFEAGDRDGPEVHRADAPEALVADVDAIVWWGFVDRPEPPRLSLRAREHDALQAHDVRLPSPAERLLARAEASREVILRARAQLILVHPERIAAERQPIHPLWSELRGRLGLVTDGAIAPVVRTPERWLAPRDPVAVVSLPPASSLWSIGRPIGLGRMRDGKPSLSVTALEDLTTCALKGVLRAHALLYRKPSGAIASGPLVLGRVGHRLVEALWHDGRLGDIAHTDVSDRLERIIAEEAAQLLSPGRALERRHLIQTLRDAVRALADALLQRGLTPVGSEESGQLVEPALGLTITYRTDLRCHDDAGHEAIIDLKWKARKHADALRRGAAVQLAGYVRGRGLQGASAPEGHYFGFTDREHWHAPPASDTLARTWQRVVATVQAIARRLDVGEIIVPPLSDDLASLLDVEAADRLATDASKACRYCDMKAICGHAWHVPRRVSWRARR